MKKTAIFFLTAIFLVFSAIGCKKKDEESSTINETGNPISITHWYWADNSEYSAKMQEIVNDFNEENQQNIKVTAEEYPWDGGGYSETLFTAAMGGGGPDTAA